MGREIKRVPLDFDWPIGQTWLGYAVNVEFPKCPDCDVSGLSPAARARRDELHGNGYCHDYYRKLKAEFSEADLMCPRCLGFGDLATPELREWADAMPEVNVPEGEGWQLWETVGDSPLSPVFAASDELVDWMTVNPWRLNPSLMGAPMIPSDRETAERFVAAGGAPTFVVRNPGGLVDGVTEVASR